MYLTSKEVQEKYGIPTGHCKRDLVEYGHCRTKKYKFCGRICDSYYEPDIKRILKDKKERKEKHLKNYSSRPDVMRGTKSKLKKVLPNKMYIKLRNAWFGMMRRCYSCDRPDYHHYKKCKVQVCDEWLNDFDSFALWALNNGVKEDLTLDRINNDGGYCPENCRWVSRTAQNNNTSANISITYKRQTKTIAEWAKEYGHKYHTLYARIAKGWPVEQALTIGAGGPGIKKNFLVLEYNGEAKPIAQWAKEYNIPYNVILNRVKSGWPAEKAITTPVKRPSSP